MGTGGVRRTGLALVSLLALTLPGAGGCDAAPEVPAGPLRIATGSPNAVYHTYGQALAGLIGRDLPQVQASVLTTAASVENVAMVADGRAEVGFTQADVAGEAAVSGRIVALARLYDDYLHLVVRDAGPIHTLADLRGRRVSRGVVGSGTEVTATRVIKIAGLDPETDVRSSRLGLDDSVAALRDGKIDAFFFSGGLPVAAVAGLAKTVPIRLIDLGETVTALRRNYGEVYVARAVPPSTYGTPAVTTVGNPNYLIVRAEMPASLAHAVTRLLMDGRDELARAHPAGERLNPRQAISTYPLPLHPGAAHYYRDNKL